MKLKVVILFLCLAQVQLANPSVAPDAPPVGQPAALNLQPAAQPAAQPAVPLAQPIKTPQSAPPSQPVAPTGNPQISSPVQPPNIAAPQGTVTNQQPQPVGADNPSPSLIGAPAAGKSAPLENTDRDGSALLKNFDSEQYTNPPNKITEPASQQPQKPLSPAAPALPSGQLAPSPVPPSAPVPPSQVAPPQAPPSAPSVPPQLLAPAPLVPVPAQGTQPKILNSAPIAPPQIPPAAQSVPIPAQMPSSHLPPPNQAGPQISAPPEREVNPGEESMLAKLKYQTKPPIAQPGIVTKPALPAGQAPPQNGGNDINKLQSELYAIEHLINEIREREHLAGDPSKQPKPPGSSNNVPPQVEGGEKAERIAALRGLAFRPPEVNSTNATLNDIFCNNASRGNATIDCLLNHNATFGNGTKPKNGTANHNGSTTGKPGTTTPYIDFSKLGLPPGSKPIVLPLPPDMQIPNQAPGPVPGQAYPGFPSYPPAPPGYYPAPAPQPYDPYGAQPQPLMYAPAYDPYGGQPVFYQKK